MSPAEIKKLLGGYATGTLTEEERRILFQAALQDQETFNALADDQALKDLLDNPAVRRRLLGELEQKKPGFIDRFAAWLARPRSWAIAGGVAAALVLVVVMARVNKTPAEPDPTLLASRRLPRPPEVASPVERPSPAPPALRVKALRNAPSQMERESGKAEALPVPMQSGQRPAAAVAPVPQEMAERRHEADARQTAQQTARQLFYSSPVRDPQAMALRATGEASPRTAAKQEAPTPESQLLGKKPGAPVGIRYAILRQVVEGSTFANAGAEFRAGDLVRLSVESNADGFVYLFRREAHGGWQQLDSGRIRKRTPYQIPRGEPVRLAEGGMTLILMLLQKEPPVILNLPVSRDQENRRILVERMKEPVPTGGNAEVVYAVDPSPAPESPVIVEIPLKLR